MTTVEPKAHEAKSSKEPKLASAAPSGASVESMAGGASSAEVCDRPVTTTRVANKHPQEQANEEMFP